MPQRALIFHNFFGQLKPEEVLNETLVLSTTVFVISESVAFVIVKNKAETVAIEGYGLTSEEFPSETKYLELSVADVFTELLKKALLNVFAAALPQIVVFTLPSLRPSWAVAYWVDVVLVAEFTNASA